MISQRQIADRAAPVLCIWGVILDLTWLMARRGVGVSPKGSVGGGARVFGGFPPLEDDACHEEHRQAPVLLGTPHVLRSILRRILRHVLHVQRGRRRACDGPGVSHR